MLFYEKDLKDAQVEEIKTVKAKFKAFDETLKTVFETTKIQLFPEIQAINLTQLYKLLFFYSETFIFPHLFVNLHIIRVLHKSRAQINCDKKQ